MRIFWRSLAVLGVVVLLLLIAAPGQVAWDVARRAYSSRSRTITPYWVMPSLGFLMLPFDTCCT